MRGGVPLAARLGLARLPATSSMGVRKVYGAQAIQRVVTDNRKGKRYGNTSRYFPHQGPRECARRVRQMAARG